MALEIQFRGRDLGSSFARAMRRRSEAFVEAQEFAAQDVLDRILELGRRDISSAGKFGPRWTSGLTGTVDTDLSNNVVIEIEHTIPYFTVFTDGKVIQGKPMLWIPLSFATDAKGKRARDFGEPLFRVNRKSGKAPLLLSSRDREPKYFGKESVTIPKKFNLFDIARDILKNEYPRFLRKRLEEAL